MTEINNNEEEFNKIFSRNLRKYLSTNNMTQLELSKKLGVGTTSVYNWCNGIKTPRMDKVDAMCSLFGCRRADLIEDKSNQEHEHYYLNEETSAIAQEIFENKELRLLFDTAKDADPEDLSTVHNMLLALKRKEQNRD